MTHHRDVSPEKWYRVIALGVLLAAFFLRVHDLGTRSLWFDEAMEQSIATSSIVDIASNVRDGIQDPPLYSAILHGWMKIGTSELHMRFLSALLSVVGVAGALALGRRFGGNAGALVSGALCAVLPSQIRYAQEVGQYALMGAAITLNILALTRLRSRQGMRPFLAWSITAIICAYSYYGAVFTVILPFVLELGQAMFAGRGATARKGALALVLFAFAITPLAAYFLPSQLFRGPTTNAFQFGLGAPLEELTRFLTESQRLVAFQVTGWPWSFVPEFIAPGLFGLAIVASLRVRSRLHGWLLAVWLCYYIAGRIGLYPFGFRYGLIMTPLIAPLLGRAVSFSKMSPALRTLSNLSCAGLFLIAIVSYPGRSFRDAIAGERNWAWPETEDMRPVFEFWRENRKSDERTYVYYGASPAFAYYLNQRPAEAVELPPTWYSECWKPVSPPYCRTNGIHFGPWIRNSPPEDKLISLREELGGSPVSFWIVFSHTYPGEDAQIMSELARDYQIERSYTASNAAAFRVIRR